MKILKSKWLLIGLILIGISTYLIISNSFQLSENVSNGILLDLVVTTPLIYLFVIWKKQIPKFTVAYVILIGILLAKFILPESQQHFVQKLQWIAIPLIELGLLSIVLLKIRALTKEFKTTPEYDFFDKVTLASQQVFPKGVGKIVATEISMFHYLFNFSKHNVDKQHYFTYYKRSGIKMILSVFLFLIVIETIVIHLVISQWSENFAWILTFLSVYTLLQVLAIMRSMSRRLISIDYESKTLHLRYGIGSQSEISFNKIQNIEKYKNSHSKNKKHAFLSTFDLLDTNNLTIELKSENILSKLYGIQKMYQSISFFIDKRDEFQKLIKEIIDKESSIEVTVS